MLKLFQCYVNVLSAVCEEVAVSELHLFMSHQSQVFNTPTSNDVPSAGHGRGEAAVTLAMTSLSVRMLRKNCEVG